MDKDSRFPSLLTAFAELVAAEGVGDGELRMYSRFNESYCPSDWTRDPTSDEEFATFAVNGVGSQYALWLRETKDPLRAPVVLFGRDGEVGVISEDLLGFIALFAAGVDPSLAIADGKVEPEKPNEALERWLRANAPGTKFGTPTEILARAAKAHPDFADHARAIQAASRAKKAGAKPSKQKPKR